MLFLSSPPAVVDEAAVAWCRDFVQVRGGGKGERGLCLREWGMMNLCLVPYFLWGDSGSPPHPPLLLAPPQDDSGAAPSSPPPPYLPRRMTLELPPSHLGEGRAANGMRPLKTGV